jgi:autotransporter-associated beta strand protein
MMMTCALGAAISLSAMNASFGATQYWDRDNAAGLQGGNGHWRTSGGGGNGTSWNDATGSGSRDFWGDGNDAVFNAAGGGEAQVTNIVEVNSILFDAADYSTNGGGTIELIGPNITTNFDAEIGTIIGGSVGLTKLGAATLTLLKANVYTGATMVAVGGLNLNASGGNAIGGDLSIDGASAVVTLLASNQIVDSAAIVIDNGGTLNIGAFSDTVDSVTVHAGSILGTTGVLAASSFIIVEENVTIDAILSGINAPLTKQDAGVTMLLKANTYGGETHINNGTLKLSGSGSIHASSRINVADGASFDVSNLAGYTIQNGQTLEGIGTISGDITIGSGATLSPGNSPGLLTQDSGDLTWDGAGNHNWQIYDADGSAGVGYDLYDVLDGSLELGGASGFNINLWSLSSIGPDVDGDAINFDNTQDYTWTLVSTTGGVNGFDAANFNINLVANNGTAGFTNDLDGGSFSLAVVGNDLVLQFTAIPAPAALPAGLGLLGALSVARRPRRGNK